MKRQALEAKNPGGRLRWTLIKSSKSAPANSSSHSPAQAELPFASGFAFSSSQSLSFEELGIQGSEVPSSSKRPKGSEQHFARFGARIREVREAQAIVTEQLTTQNAAAENYRAQQSNPPSFISRSMTSPARHGGEYNGGYGGRYISRRDTAPQYGYSNERLRSIPNDGRWSLPSVGSKRQRVSSEQAQGAEMWSPPTAYTYKGNTFATAPMQLPDRAPQWNTNAMMQGIGARMAAESRGRFGTLGKKGSFVCRVCNKQLSSRYGLKRHFRTHTGERPFACTVCNQRFKQKAHLKAHMFIHENIKPFECKLCGKRFRHKCNLKMHANTCSQHRLSASSRPPSESIEQRTTKVGGAMEVTE